MKRSIFLCCLACVCFLSAPVQAQLIPVIEGKGNWLFYGIDFTDAKEQSSIDVSLDLIAKTSRLLAENGTQLLVVIVPIKSRIYSEYLPDQKKLSPFLQDSYQKTRNTLQQKGVRVVDLNTVFARDKDQHADFPLFIRIDSHWSQPGAFLAAQTVKDVIAADSALTAAVAKSPSRRFDLAWSPLTFKMATGDLVSLLPPGRKPPAPEQIKAFSVQAQEGGAASLESKLPGVVLLGSSYSGKWTGFPEALKFMLQRDIPVISIPADRGQWFALNNYLADAGFQKHRPDLLILEIPERALAATPSYPYRDARYVMKDSDWLRKAAALIDTRCRNELLVEDVQWQQAGQGSKELSAQQVSFSDTRKEDFLAFAIPPKLSGAYYLRMFVETSGSPSVKTAFLAGDEVKEQGVHLLDGEGTMEIKIPLPAAEQANRVKIYPGTGKAFKAARFGFCRLPDAATGRD